MQVVQINDQHLVPGYGSQPAIREKLGSNVEDSHCVSSENVLAKMLWPELAMPHPCVLGGVQAGSPNSPTSQNNDSEASEHVSHHRARKQVALHISARVIYSPFLHRTPLQSQGLPPYRTAFQHPGEPGADGGNDAMALGTAVR